MKYYKRQHEYYCGIDLHANSMHVCVVDQAGKKHAHKNFNTKTPETFVLAFGPFRKRALNGNVAATAFQTHHNVRGVQPPLGLNEHGAAPFTSPSRMISTAVFHTGVFITTPEDTGRRVSDSLASTRHSAER